VSELSTGGWTQKHDQIDTFKVRTHSLFNTSIILNRGSWGAGRPEGNRLGIQREGQTRDVGQAGRVRTRNPESNAEVQTRDRQRTVNKAGRVKTQVGQESWQRYR